MSTPLVTIRCLVYNHEPYLRQCLDGFVMQKTNFPFEAIVHDDASTDRSAEIIREYAERYPDIIKPIFETENQYSKRDGSIRRILNEHTRGKYVAMCEGDDYWTDPLKLQKQVDVLEHDSNIGLCYTKARLYNQKKGEFLSDIALPYNGIKSMLVRNPIVTLTVVYRRELYDSYLKEIEIDNKKWLTGDYPLWLWIASQKDISFIDEVTAVYRYLENSASHSHRDFQKQLAFNESIKNIQLFYIQKLNMDEKLVSLINDEFYRRVVTDCLINGDRISCIDNLKRIENKTFREKVKRVLFHSTLIFKYFARKL